MVALETASCANFGTAGDEWKRLLRSFLGVASVGLRPVLRTGAFVRGELVNIVTDEE